VTRAKLPYRIAIINRLKSKEEHWNDILPLEEV